jgi:hypothetical protein
MRRLPLSLLCVLPLLAGSCGEDTVLVPPDDIPDPDVGVDETRNVQLRFMRFDVEGFEQRLDLEDLQALPPKTLDAIWVLDLALHQLTLNSLAQIRDMSDEEAEQLPQATQNMRELLTMTPDNANMEGTKLEELIALSGAVGIPPAKSLANLMGIGVTDEIVPIEFAADVFVDNLIATHPNAQFRPGPVDEDHPDGQWPVTPGAVPVTMADVANNFANLPVKFGKVGDHPGFVDVAEGVIVTEEDFQLIVKVSAQALPYKGLDLTNASQASVNSKPGQIDTLFDFSDPDWMRIEGMAETPMIQDLRHTIFENDAFIDGGSTKDPTPNGNSEAWSLPPWEFEHMIAEVARRWGLTIPAHCDEYELNTGATVFTACVEDDGWVVMETFNDVGDPPPPAYFWDLQMEIAQTRLHDFGLSEGEADIQAFMQNVEVGISPDELMEQIRTNAEQNPEGLKELARAITNSTVGDADFYYYRTLPDAPSAIHGDWLYFIIEDDLRRDENGDIVRPYDYEHVGFYADAGLNDKVSDLSEVEGDDAHEKVRVEPGDALFIEDAQGLVFRIDVRAKPSTYRVELDVTRVK